MIQTTVSSEVDVEAFSPGGIVKKRSKTWNKEEGETISGVEVEMFVSEIIAPDEDE